MVKKRKLVHFGGLLQDRSVSITDTLEILQSCSKISTFDGLMMNSPQHAPVITSYYNRSQYMYTRFGFCRVSFMFDVGRLCIYPRGPLQYYRGDLTVARVLMKQPWRIWIPLQWSHNERVSIVRSTVGSGADQRKHISFASLAFVRRIHRWPLFPFDDVIMHRIHESTGMANNNQNNGKHNTTYGHIILHTLFKRRKIAPGHASYGAVTSLTATMNCVYSAISDMTWQAANQIWQPYLTPTK